MPTPRTGKANNEKAERNKRVHTELGDRLADERRSAERAYWQDQEQLADEIRRGLKLSGLTKEQLAARAGISTETLRNALSSTRRQKNPISMNTMHRVRMAFQQIGLADPGGVPSNVPGLNWIALPDAAPQATINESRRFLRDGKPWINDEHLYVHDEFSVTWLDVYGGISYAPIIELQRMELASIAKILSTICGERLIEIISLTSGHGWNDVFLGVELLSRMRSLPLVMYVINCNNQMLYEATSLLGKMNISNEKFVMVPTLGRHHSFYRFYPFNSRIRRANVCRLITIMGTYFNVEHGEDLIRNLCNLSQPGDILFLDLITPWGNSREYSIKHDPRMNRQFDWMAAHENAIAAVIEKIIQQNINMTITYSAVTGDEYRSGSLYSIEMNCCVDTGSGPLISLAAWRVHRHDPAQMAKKIETLGWRQVRELPLVSSHWNTGHLLFIKD